MLKKRNPNPNLSKNQYMAECLTMGGKNPICLPYIIRKNKEGNICKEKVGWKDVQSAKLMVKL